MGRLVKNHWARLLLLTASIVHLGATIECFIWPKILWDFTTKHFDHALRPVPALQVVNLLAALFGIAWEWPLPPLTVGWLHGSIGARLLIYPASALLAALMYQGATATVFYLTGTLVWLWALWEEETVCTEPWAVPRRRT